MKWILYLWVVLPLAMTAGTVRAQDLNEFRDAEMKALLERVQRLEKELQKVQRPWEAPQPISYDDGAAKGADTAPAMPKAETKKTETKKKTYPDVKLGGFFQADAMRFSQDANNIATVGDAQDGYDFRRARLYGYGDVFYNTSFKLEMDFAFPGRPQFMDVWVDFKYVPTLGHVRVGQWRQPFSMTGLTSVTQLPFLERALPFAFAPFRQIGFGFYDYSVDETATWALSAFRYPTDVFGNNVGDPGGFGLAGRFTELLYYDNCGRRLLHVGVAYSFADPSNNGIIYQDATEVFMGQGAQSRIGTFNNIPAGSNPSTVPTRLLPFVSTGIIPARNYNLIGFEAAGVYNSAWFQAEWMHNTVRQIGGPNLNYTGGYVQGGYFLTGEVRQYDGKSGVLTQPNPLRNVGCGGCGAWEVVARGSFIDLSDMGNVIANPLGPLVPGQASGIRDRRGTLTDFTFGVNWYMNPNTKFQFNYIRAMLNNNLLGRSNCDIVAMRAQLNF